MTAGRPAKPVEQKLLLGNPGRRPINAVEISGLSSGYVEPIRPLVYSGKQLWDSVFSEGELWVSSRTDIHLLQLTAEQLDRRDYLLSLYPNEPNDRTLNMNLNDLEKQITSNLGLLGFTPSDRSRLGFTIAKTESKLEQLRKMKDK